MSRVFRTGKGNISFIMSWLKRFIHLLHKYDWRHVTDTDDDHDVEL